MRPGIYSPDSHTFQQKGVQVFSWLNTIQRKPQGMDISLRQNRALNLDTGYQCSTGHARRDWDGYEPLWGGGALGVVGRGGPGNTERAGTRYRGKTGTGNRSRRRGWVPWAWGARKTPPCLGRPLRRLAGRIGKKKAALAIAHPMLVIVSHLLALGTCDEEARYDQGNPRQEARERTRALTALARLGSPIPVARAASAPGGRLISASSVRGLPDVPKKRPSLSGSGVSTRSRLLRRNAMEGGIF